MILIIGGASMGKQAFGEKHFPDRTLIKDYEETVLAQLKSGSDPVREAERLPDDGQVILMTIIGEGIVPLAAEDRLWREKAGEVSQVLAERAEAVYYVTAGLGQRIK